MIAHDLAVVRHISDTIGVMYLGRLVEEAPSDDLYAQPLHPYTIALMSAIPIPDPVVEDRRERILLKGDLPEPGEPAEGLPLPHPLPVPAADPLRHRGAGAARDRVGAGTQGGLPLRRADPERRDHRPGPGPDRLDAHPDGLATNRSPPSLGVIALIFRRPFGSEGSIEQ